MSKLELIQNALQALEPQHLEVYAESHMHSRAREAH